MHQWAVAERAAGLPGAGPQSASPTSGSADRLSGAALPSPAGRRVPDRSGPLGTTSTGRTDSSRAWDP